MERKALHGGNKRARYNDSSPSRQYYERVIDAERNRMFEWLYTLMAPSSDASLLEIGGPTYAFREISNRFEISIVLNLSRRKGIGMIQADARYLPFRDKAFDYVFSNATLEHIPRVDWTSVASEIVRVAARGFFVVTPNYWFPYEPHYRLPCFQWVPESVKHFLLFRLGLKIGGISRANYQRIDLPQRRHLQELFPEANVNGWGVLIPRHLVVWQRISQHRLIEV